MLLDPLAVTAFYFYFRYLTSAFSSLIFIHLTLDLGNWSIIFKVCGRHKACVERPEQQGSWYNLSKYIEVTYAFLGGTVVSWNILPKIRQGKLKANWRNTWSYFVLHYEEEIWLETFSWWFANRSSYLEHSMIRDAWYGHCLNWRHGEHVLGSSCLQRSLLQTQDCKGDDKSFVNVAHFSLFLIRTPLHCAASCNNVQVCKFLVESGAAVFATTYSDLQTAADKCEEMEEGYIQCSQFLYGMCMSIQ